MAHAHRIVEDTAKAMGIELCEVFEVFYKTVRYNEKQPNEHAQMAYTLWEKNRVIPDDMIDFCADILAGRLFPVLIN